MHWYPSTNHANELFAQFFWYRETDSDEESDTETETETESDNIEAENGYGTIAQGSSVA